MGLIFSRQRIYAALLALGAGILLCRAIAMVARGSLNVLVSWAGILLVTELLVDLCCLLASIRWLILKEKAGSRLPLRLGAAAAILHSLRVLIFVMGRVGPWINFDVRPEQRAMHGDRWTWTGVYIAAILSVLGIAGVIVIWALIRRARKRRNKESSL